MDRETELTQLRAETEQLRTELRELRAVVQDIRPAPAAPAARPAPEPTGAPALLSRRRLLGMAAAGAGGVALAAGTGVTPAAADDPDDVTLGATKTNTVASATVVNTTAALSGVQLLVQSGDTYAPSPAARDSALAAYAGPSGSADTAVYAFSGKSNGSAIYASSNLGVGAEVVGGVAALRLSPSAAAGPPKLSAHNVGDVQSFTDGIWLCVGAGTPGTWRKISGAAAAGVFHAITPSRVYDSRVVSPKTRTTKGQTRTVSVANKITSSGDTSTANIVPAGAQAIVANLTVTSTSGTGFLSVTPSGGSSTSSINWFGSGQTLANSITVAVSSTRTVAVYAQGTAHFLLDVAGYYL